MRLVGILSWYDEKPAWLSAAVASLAKAEIEHVVAVDGAFALYPGGRASSPSDQHEAITETARGVGMGYTLHVPSEVWLGNEVEKRTFCFSLAERITDENDWYFIQDADHVVLDAVGIRRALDETDLDVGIVRMRDSDQDALSSYPSRALFRALRGLHLFGSHDTYLTADGRKLRGNVIIGREPETEPAIDLSFVEVEHRRRERERERSAKQRQYYERRDRLGIEKDGVPA